MGDEVQNEATAVTPDPAQWERIEDYLRTSLFPSAKFRVEGHEITVQKGRTGENKFSLLVFIDGQIKGEWTAISSEPIAIVRTVWRRRTFTLYKPREKARLIKTFGKRGAYRMFPKLDVQTEYFVPDFNTAKSLVRQFKKVEDLQLLEMG